MTQKRDASSSGQTAARLTGLYGSYGYVKYKMSKFEEYDLYARNRDFLQSGELLTFTGPRGVLMALKPDITLSIIKNAKDAAKRPYKLYYNESVYRAERGTREFKEITQIGLELIGDIDLYSSGEVLCLAAKSLELISDSTVLDLSHQGLACAALDYAGITSEAMRTKALELIAGRSSHELEALCGDAGIVRELYKPLIGMADIYGEFEDAIAQLRSLCTAAAFTAAADELKSNYELLKAQQVSCTVNLDPAISGGQNYYNGLVFRGYADAAPRAVLSGGRYDGLVNKFGIGCKAMGFAVYMDVIEEYMQESRDFDADVLLLYGNNSDYAAVFSAAQALRESGLTVRVQQNQCADIRARRVMDISGGMLKEVGQDA